MGAIGRYHEVERPVVLALGVDEGMRAVVVTDDGRAGPHLCGAGVGSAEHLEQRAPRHADAMAAGAPVGIAHRHHPPATQRGAVQFVDALSDRRRPAGKPHASEDAEARRLEQEAGADRPQAGAAFEDGHVVALLRQKDGRGLPGRSIAHDRDLHSPSPG